MSETFMSEQLEKLKQEMSGGGGLIPMPPGMIRHNTNTQCDMWVGPCACGAWHKGIRGFFEEYRFLSNFHLVKIEYEGLVYPSTENAFQAAKTLDLVKREEFLPLEPNKAKWLGRKVQLRSDWEQIKDSVMETVVRQKFSQDELKEKLLATGDVYLEETNWWKDTYWGVCNEVGKNKLGFILMKVREELRKG